MDKRIVWVMSQHDSDLLQETLQLDSTSHAFEISLRESIARALKRVKVHDQRIYNQTLILRGRSQELDRVDKMMKGEAIT
jgi:hypothetical protein